MSLKDVNQQPIQRNISLNLNLKKQKLNLMFDDQLNLLVIKENK